MVEITETETLFIIITAGQVTSLISSLVVSWAHELKFKSDEGGEN